MNGANGDKRNRIIEVIFPLAVSCVLVAVSWGTNNTRIETHEREIQSLKVMTGAHDREIAATDAQYAEILRRLEYIDKRLDRLQRVDQP